MSEKILVKPDVLHDFMVKVFRANGLPEDDAQTSAEVLLKADLRGIDSHGVARLHYYVGKLKNGTVKAVPDIRVVNENPTSALIDGDSGIGPVVGRRSMELAIKKADEVGAGFVSVRRSNHYGIAGYYSMMAMKRDMVGISMTNSVCMVAPTFSTKSMLGTNPIAVGVPCGEERPWLLDMATSTAPFGKLEIALRSGEKIPRGWVQDSDGAPWDDPTAPFKGGALTPLGSTREMGSHKGYGLACMVDILCAVLSGAKYGPHQEGLTSMRAEASDVGHFFGAIRLDGFRPVDEFKANMDEMVKGFKDAPTSKGRDRVYVHGEIEYDFEEKRRKEGIPLHPAVVASLKNVADEHDIPLFG